ncbi:phytosulfokines [Herrania umbratica]|uniref:Phytosulfokine n=1 Tax=Herrania umbratica TaxID=108875 RepID=A0A6J1ACD6_9ROSI|nr:phytosulfokines [Herrania umbratica]
MSNLRTLFIAALLINFMLSYAARPEPALPLTHHEEVEAEKVEIDENCEGAGKEECLMRRTLAAHVDYIYTQNHKP